MHKLTQEAATQRRVHELFDRTDAAKFGALFRVDEMVWKAGLEPEYAARSTRDAHPGCSLRKLGATLGPVPLLHGTSKRSYTLENIVVKDIYGRPHTTYFGGLDPIPVDHEQWMRKNVRPAEKTSLDVGEMCAMQALCARKGW